MLWALNEIVFHNMLRTWLSPYGLHPKRIPVWHLLKIWLPQQILNAYISEINEMEQAEIDAINEDIPFKKTEVQLKIP